jgi:hypothetical protein
MPLDLGTPTTLYFVADENTPQTLLAFRGHTVGLTAAQFAALPPGPAIDTVTYQGTVLPGFQRPAAGGVGVEWVITAPTDPDDAMLAALPGGLGWAVPASRDTWTAADRALRKAGLPPNAIRTRFPLLYDAAVDNYKAQHGIP